jgi:hypothetical protein
LGIDQRDTRILADSEVKALAKAVCAMLGPTFSKISPDFARRAEDTIRFHAVAAMFAGSRESRGLSVKQVATPLRVPQYRLKAIERPRLSEVRAEILGRYAAFLGLEDWMKAWVTANPRLAARLGLPKQPLAPTPRVKLTTRERFPSSRLLK